MKYFFSLVVLGLMLLACNDSIEVGSEILNNTLDVQVDTVEIPAQMILADSVLTYTKTTTNNFPNSIYMVGELEDSDYGSVEAITYFGMTFRDSIPDGILNMDIDSVVLIIPYDTIGNYGPDGGEFEVSLHQLVETFEIDNDESLYSEDGFEYEIDSDFSGTITANHRDSVTINNYVADTAGVLAVPQLRLKLDAQKWIDFFASIDLDGDYDLIEQNLKGYALKATSTDKNSLIGLNLNFDALNTVENSGDIRFFLRDTTRRVFDISLGRFRQNQFIHDYAGSDIQNIIDSGSQEEFYIQSQGGVEVEFDLAVLKENSADFILNSASIEITVLSSPDEEVYPLPEKLFAKYIQDGDELLVVDINISDKFSNPIVRTGDNGETVTTYSIDITDHATSIKDGDVESSKIILFPSTKSNRANRVKICGPDHPDTPTRMKLVKTTL